MFLRKLVRYAIACGFVGLFLGQQMALAADADVVIARAKEMLQGNKPADAYDLLEKDADANAANVEYNYLLGVAALDSNRPGLAVFAFERALTQNPQHLPARAELGRAYLALGEAEAARDELEQVRRLNPPPEVARTIGDFLGAIDVYERTRRESAGMFEGLHGYLQLDNGFDTNINTATNATAVTVPLLGNTLIQLNPLFTAQSSPFSGVGAGINYQHRITDSVTAFVGLDAGGRYNWREELFYTYTVDGLVGLRVANGSNTYTVGMNTHQYYVNRFHLDDARGFFAEWQRLIDRNNKISVFGQYFDYDHPFVPTLATNLYLGGVSWAHAFETKGSPLMSLTAYGANDNQKSDDSTVGRSYYGGRGSIDYKFSERLKAVAGAGMQQSRYDGVNIFFGNRRREKNYTANFGLAFVPEKKWTISPQILYTRNESNIPLTDYNRKQALISVRRDF